MGADIRELRERIKSVDSTLHLTNAMGLVASSKIRRATDRMMKGREYALALEDIITQLSSLEECKRSPYMREDNTGKVCLAIVGGDRGLAGGYNANVFRLIEKLKEEYDVTRVIPIGKRACERYASCIVSAEGYSYACAAELANDMCQCFKSGEFDRFGIVCTKYISMMSQEAQVEWLLPLKRNARIISSGAIFEPDEPTVLDAIIPEYIAGMIVSCVKESFACEVAARRVAMDNAGKNAQEMLDSLGLEYNRARQSGITQEITEIVAGSDTDM